MEQYFEKLGKWILSLKAWLVFILGLSLLVINNFLWPEISNQLAKASIFRGTEKWADMMQDKTMLLLYGPIIETLVFQYALLHLLLKFLRPFIAVCLAALVFGIFHFYNPVYFAATVIPGFIFASLFYVYWKLKGELFEALLLIILIHSAANAISYYFNN